ncbi:MAG: C4-dicarboxylate ABC transporter permease [Pelagibacterales bacterium]|nr:C4-dicarboxylate ABC transporter permease [Pelagibacterales bacterium]OUU61200.1 MAG: C4-dicarboxylate ABC transporter permease [Alphaproteobacteria bacterium TMED62]
MFKKLLKISKILEKLVIFFGKLGSWMALPLISIIIFDIITRRFFVLGSTKLQEMEWHLHTSLFLLVIGYAYLKDAHVRIEIVREQFSTIIKAILETLGILLFLIPYTILVIYFGIDFVVRSFSVNEVSSALTGLSHRWIIKSFIPLGMFLLFLAGVSLLIKNLIYIYAIIKNKKEYINQALTDNPIYKKQITEKN